MGTKRPMVRSIINGIELTGYFHSEFETRYVTAPCAADDARAALESRWTNVRFVETDLLNRHIFICSTPRRVA